MSYTRRSEDPVDVDKLRKKLKRLEKMFEKILNNHKDSEQENPQNKENLVQNEPGLKDPIPKDPVLEDPILNSPETENHVIDDSITKLLGEEGEEQENWTILHSELKRRWQSILKDGLNKEARESLLSKYQIPKNCSELKPPILNDLIKEVLNEAGLNRDNRIVEKQRKLGLAISAMGTILSNLLDDNSDQNKEIIETLSDSCRLLCDIFHSDSITRKSLIIPGLNKDMKELINNVHITEYLFGNDLQEKVKACKATKSSAKDLKIPPPTKPSMNKRPVALNSRGPLRSVVQPRPSGQWKEFRAALQPRPTPPQRHQPKTNYYRTQQRNNQYQQRRQ